MYPSGSLTPSANPAIKAHKPAKDFPARLITSHIGAPQEALSSLLNKILQPFVEGSKHVCKNSHQFVEIIKKLKIGTLEKMVSFDAAALFPSVPIEDCIKYIYDLLTQDATLHQRTKLTPTDITDLIRICLSSSDFVYNDRHHTTKDSGPIGLSLMVLVSQIWMTHTMDSAIAIARQRLHAIPRHIFIYMDDIWCVIRSPPVPRRPGLRSESQPSRNPTEDFRECLNAVHPRVQFTMEEEEEQSIAFLDVYVTRQNDGTFTTKIYRKPSNTNIGLKPQSCQDLKTVVASFKGELYRCHRLCTSLEQTKKEIEFTLNLYEDNGNNREMLKKIADTYEPPQTKNKHKDKDKTTKTKTPGLTHRQTIELFCALPFHPLKRVLKKAGVNTVFQSGPKLQNILCGANKTRPNPDKKKGVYRYQCPCSDKSVYIGQTARACDVRWKEHGGAIRRENWGHSGISQHHQNCTHQFDASNASVITTMQGKRKKKLNYDLKIREALEIRRHKCGPGKGLNEDMGAYVKRDIWDPELHNLDKLK